jgi:hypothetical protein
VARLTSEVRTPRFNRSDAKAIGLVEASHSGHAQQVRNTAADRRNIAMGRALAGTALLRQRISPLRLYYLLTH